MTQSVIEVQNLSKVFRLGTTGTGSLRQELGQWWSTKILGKENPFFRLPENENIESSNQLLWALQNVNFEVAEGEAFGIIGNNGSGKSTLLKIISRIISPTRGTVKGRGKVSSLLEVGTGFYPDLTGRQNIFTSGYILGMSKAEISKKFDEIVAFSGIEPFIDTPVKRYSSGMYMRLAFSVAAHLEPDILIVDEVLAVGDASFQQKCLGKMQEASKSGGRTILFVSHNLPAISNICNRTLWLHKGKVQEIGKPQEVIKNYLASLQDHTTVQNWDIPSEAPGNTQVRMKVIEVYLEDNEIDPYITVRTPFKVYFEFWNFCDGFNININLSLFTNTGECLFNIGSPTVRAEKGIMAMECRIPGNLLNSSVYSISLTIVKNNAEPIFDFSHCITFEVADVREGINYYGKWEGLIRPQLDYSIYLKQPMHAFPD